MVASSERAVRRSRDRGCKGHRILRRVLVGGRHLRTSRAIGFHEQVVTATLATSSRGQRRERDSSRRAGDERRKAERRPCQCHERGSCDRGVRGLVGAGAVGRKRPRSHSPPLPSGGGDEKRQKKAARVSPRSAEAFASAVKHSVPRSSRTKPKTSCPAQAGPPKEVTSTR